MSAATIFAGQGGHEHELVVNLEGYGHHGSRGDLTAIPEAVEGAIADGLPESWKIDNRGSRLEIHPSGRRYAGWDDLDVAAVEACLQALGYTVKVVRS